MKKLLLTLLAMPISIAAQTTGPQPLFIQNITISPNGCSNPDALVPTANISVTASGGIPTSSGQYTYNITNANGTPVTDLAPQTGVTANFTDVPTNAGGDSVSFNLTVTDSSGTPGIEYEVAFTEANPNQTISMTITSLPLGGGKGCITLDVVNPGGSPTNTGPVEFAIVPTPEVSTATFKEVSKTPFQQTFSAFRSTTTFTAFINVHGDCTPSDDESSFSIQFPFPQGIANALKAYIFNKYCSCALQSNTIFIEPV